MSKYEVLDLESTKYFDILVEADFAKRLDAAQIVQILQTITDIFTDKMAHQLCQGISSLQVTETNLTIQLRYATVENSQVKPDVSSRAKTQFLFYLLAKIDLLYSLSDVPFPDGWRAWLDLPEHIEKFGYDNA